MSTSIAVNAVHHFTLTVTDPERSSTFYGLLGFQKVAEFGIKTILSNGSMLMALNPPPDASQAIDDDRFSENRVGLDHLSFAVESHADLEAAIQLFDAQGIEHGEIIHLPPFGIYVLTFRDPDNIQLELTAPDS